MSEWVEKELRSNFARATRAGHRAANTEPRATRVRYRALEDALRIEFANAVPRLSATLRGRRSVQDPGYCSPGRSSAESLSIVSIFPSTTLTIMAAARDPRS